MRLEEMPPFFERNVALGHIPSNVLYIPNTLACVHRTIHRFSNTSPTPEPLISGRWD